MHILKYFFFVGSSLLGLLFLLAPSINRPPGENPLLQGSASLAALRSIANHGERPAAPHVPFPRSERVAAMPEPQHEVQPAGATPTAQPKAVVNARAELPAKKRQRHATAKTTSKRKIVARKLRQPTRMVENVQDPLGFPMLRAW